MISLKKRKKEEKRKGRVVGCLKVYDWVMRDGSVLSYMYVFCTVEGIW